MTSGYRFVDHLMPRESTRGPHSSVGPPARTKPRTSSSDQRSNKNGPIGAVLCAVIAGTVAPATSAHAVTGTADSSTFAARIVIGNDERACSAALVDREWLLTAASCFAANPAQDLTVAAGVPERQIVELVPRPDRDVVLTRLHRPVTNVTPVAVTTAAPGVGEELKFAGFGRTKIEWVPSTASTTSPLGAGCSG
ncbi:trypsin-like serine protease [Streptomyces sp. NPDC056454]|uniref:trypsin-like serine protease n=1 Tax=Streptomyces sp. NPDC056454 TaxID=3345823 RepID=UPI0036945D36